jgi:hypothetical protein
VIRGRVAVFFRRGVPLRLRHGLRGRGGEGRGPCRDQVVAIRAQAGALAGAARGVHQGPLARAGSLPARGRARARDSRPPLPAPLDSGPDAPRLRGGAQGKGRAHRNAAHRAFFIEGPNVGDDTMVREAFREVAPCAPGYTACRPSPPPRRSYPTAPRPRVGSARCRPRRPEHGKRKGRRAFEGVVGSLYTPGSARPAGRKRADQNPENRNRVPSRCGDARHAPTPKRR